ncbi:hypothetical protein HYQ46_003990 [Verticillium longisporum]|nr:hypothetical protein HYQ46_003990 [Verticillium longisporum]
MKGRFPNITDSVGNVPSQPTSPSLPLIIRTWTRCAMGARTGPSQALNFDSWIVQVPTVPDYWTFVALPRARSAAPS